MSHIVAQSRKGRAVARQLCDSSHGRLVGEFLADLIDQPL
jgi:hypothetical protein